MIELTKQQFELLHNFGFNDILALNIMKDKGIEFDSGIIDISVDGEHLKMNTSKRDFGTIKMIKENRILRVNELNEEVMSDGRIVRKSPGKINDEIANYLEANLQSHPDNIMDNDDRLVWMSDVIKVVKQYLSDNKSDNKPPEKEFKHFRGGAKRK